MGVRQDLENGTGMATSDNCRHCPLVNEKEWIGSAMQVSLGPHHEEFSREVPISLKDAYSRCGIASREFIEYVVCPCCHSVYEYEDCIQSVGGETISKCCRHVSYPNHPQPSRRKQCGAILLKKVRSGR